MSDAGKPTSVDTGLASRAKRWLKSRAPTSYRVARSVRAAGSRFRWPLVAPRIGRLVHHAPRPLRTARLAPVAVGPRPMSIALVTPSFQHGAFLDRTLRSVLDQHYPNLEYVVQDGGSRDGTAGLLAGYRDRLAHVESAADSGQADAINRGFAKTTGEVMAWLNSDDLLLPGALAYVSRYLADHPDVDVLYGHRILIDDQDREIGRWVLPLHDDRVLRWVDFLPQETLFWRRRAWEKVGSKLDTSFRFALDWDLLLRFQDAGMRFARVPRFLGAFRIHPDQKTSSWQDVGRVEVDRLRARSLGFVPAPPRVRSEIRGYLLRHLLLDGLYRAGLLRYGDRLNPSVDLLRTTKIARTPSENG